jgi:hypothetical protein
LDEEEAALLREIGDLDSRLQKASAEPWTRA